MQKQKTPKFLLIVIIFLIGSSALTSQQQVTHPLPSGLLYLDSNHSGENSVFYVDPNTLETTLLVHQEEGHFFVEVFWSSDGLHFALLESLPRLDQPNPAYQMCIYTAIGNEVQCLTIEGLWMGGPSDRLWNEDGNYIFLLLQTEDGLPQFGIIDIATNTLIRSHILPLNAEAHVRSYFSPTGDFLAYQTRPDDQDDDEDSLRLYLLDTQTGQAQLITEQSYERCVAWTKDGMRVGAVTDTWMDTEYQFLLYRGITVFDTDGNNLSEIHPRYHDQDVWGCPFAWSHGGTRLAFAGWARKSNGGWGTEVFVVDVNRSEATRLLTPSYHTLTLEWSFDDSHLLVDSLYADFGDIRVISLDGWERTYWSENPLRSPAWQPPGD